jgi:hypothetical protein
MMRLLGLELPFKQPRHEVQMQSPYRLARRIQNKNDANFDAMQNNRIRFENVCKLCVKPMTIIPTINFQYMLRRSIFNTYQQYF